MDLYRAMYRVILEGQSYLYGMFKSFVYQKENMGELPTTEELQEWMDEWKLEAAEELRMLLGDIDG